MYLFAFGLVRFLFFNLVFDFVKIVILFFFNFDFVLLSILWKEL